MRLTGRLAVSFDGAPTQNMCRQCAAASRSLILFATASVQPGVQRPAGNYRKHEQKNMSTSTESIYINLHFFHFKSCFRICFFVIKIALLTVATVSEGQLSEAVAAFVRTYRMRTWGTCWCLTHLESQPAPPPPPPPDMEPSRLLCTWLATATCTRPGSSLSCHITATAH